MIMLFLPFCGICAENKNDFDKQIIDFYNNGANGNSQASIYMYDTSCYFTIVHNENSPLGGRSARLDFTNYEKEAQINSTTVYDITDIYDTAYLKFYIYIETESQENHALVVRMRDKSYNASGDVYLPFNLEYNSWQEVKIKLTDFEKSDMDLTKIYRVEFQKSVPTTKNFLVFVQGVSFVEPHVSNFACSQLNNGALHFTWRKNGTETYNVFRNNKKTASNLSKAEYTDENPLFGKTAEYYVEAVNGENTAGYSETIKKEATLPILENNSIILRSGSAEAYVNGKRKNIDEFNPSAAPYVKGGFAYLPLEFCTNAGGASTGEVHNGVVFEKAETIAEQTGKNFFQKGGVFVLTTQTEVPDWIFEKYADRLEFYWDNMKLGPYGYVTGMLIHPKDTDIRYVCTDVGGVYRWNKEHNEWQWLMRGLEYEDNALQNVQAIAIDEQNEDVLYAACGTGGVSALLKSEDKGETWRKLGFDGMFDASAHTRLSGESIIVDPNNSNVVYAGTRTDGLWISTNGGESFSRIADIPYKDVDATGGVTVLIADKASGTADGRTKNIYAGVYGKGVYGSTDGGKTFSLISGGPIKPYRVQVVNGVLYASGDRTSKSDTYNAGLYCYDGEWHDITPNMADGWNTVGGFAVNEKNPDIIIAQGMAYRNNDMYRSTDGGATWKNMGEKCYGGCHIVFDPDSEYGIFVPHGAGLSYIPDVTADKYTVISADAGIEEICVNEITASPSEQAPELYTSCMDKGLMISESADEYAYQATPYTYTGTGADICTKVPQYMVKSGWLGFPNTWNLQGSVCVSSDYGRTWSKTSWSKTDLVLDCTISAETGENGYPVLLIAAKTSDGNGVYRSEDFGATWEKVDGITPNFYTTWCALNQYLTADKEDGNIFYYVDTGSVSASTDGGKTWTKTSLPIGYNRITKTMPKNIGEVWTICGDGLYKSSDTGTTWKKVTIVENCHAFDFGMSETDVPALYVKGTVGGVFGIFVSDDLGETFRLISHDTESAMQTKDICGSLTESGKVYVGSSGRGVIYSQSAYACETDAVLETEQKNTNAVTLTWEYHGAYDYVRILCGGALLGETTAASYSHIPPETGKSYTYSVEICDNGGNVLSRAEKSIYVEDYSLTRNVSIFENGDNCYKTDVTLDNTLYSPFGGNSICISYPSGYDWIYRTVENSREYDISGYAENGWLSFYIYADTDETDYSIDLELWNAAWKQINKEDYTVDISGAVGKWERILIPISDLNTNGADLSRLKQIKFIKKSATKNGLKIYLQDISVYSPEKEFGVTQFFVDGQNGAYNITADFANMTQSDKTAQVAAAAYFQGKCVDVHIFDAPVPLGTVTPNEFVYTIPENVECDGVKAFVFESAENMKPMITARERRN